jgi:hypothetical protein
MMFDMNCTKMSVSVTVFLLHKRLDMVLNMKNTDGDDDCKR